MLQERTDKDKITREDKVASARLRELEIELREERMRRKVLEVSHIDGNAVLLLGKLKHTMRELEGERQVVRDLQAAKASIEREAYELRTKVRMCEEHIRQSNVS